MSLIPPDFDEISRQVSNALQEDMGSGDITAMLVPETGISRATVISREAAVMCGRPWAEEVFRQLDPSVELQWTVADGEEIATDQTILSLSGPTRSLLTGERTALNFLQLLSGTATLARSYAALVVETSCRLLDTRKTIPGLRDAQKYAVRCGGCHNHRVGLYDAFLIKENHIAACGSISAAVNTAKAQGGGQPVEVEVENLGELEEAIKAGADIVMLDNFDLKMLRQAVAKRTGQTRLEASGNITRDSLPEIAKTGVDYISIGALTKHCTAIDLSMRFA